MKRSSAVPHSRDMLRPSGGYSLTRSKQVMSSGAMCCTIRLPAYTENPSEDEVVGDVSREAVVEASAVLRG